MAGPAPPNAAASSALQALLTRHLRPALDGLKAGTLTLRGASFLIHSSLNSSDGSSSVSQTIADLVHEDEEHQQAPGVTQAIATSHVLEVAVQLYSALCSPEGLQAAIGGASAAAVAARGRRLQRAGRWQCRSWRACWSPC